MVTIEPSSNETGAEILRRLGAVEDALTHQGREIREMSIRLSDGVRDVEGMREEIAEVLAQCSQSRLDFGVAADVLTGRLAQLVDGMGDVQVRSDDVCA